MPTNRLILLVFAVFVLLAVIYIFRHIRGDPIERDRANPESRPRVEFVPDPLQLAA